MIKKIQSWKLNVRKTTSGIWPHQFPDKLEFVKRFDLYANNAP